jgi:integrase
MPPFWERTGTPGFPASLKRAKGGRLELQSRRLDEALRHAGLGEWSIDEKGRRKWANLYRFHDLRHTAVSRLIAAGADVKLVQAVAGTLEVVRHARSLHASDRRAHPRGRDAV